MCAMGEVLPLSLSLLSTGMTCAPAVFHEGCTQEALERRGD
jgi:hypothetical protein